MGIHRQRFARISSTDRLKLRHYEIANADGSIRHTCVRPVSVLTRFTVHPRWRELSVQVAHVEEWSAVASLCASVDDTMLCAVKVPAGPHLQHVADVDDQRVLDDGDGYPGVFGFGPDLQAHGAGLL